MNSTPYTSEHRVSALTHPQRLTLRAESDRDKRVLALLNRAAHAPDWWEHVVHELERHEATNRKAGECE